MKCAIARAAAQQMKIIKKIILIILIGIFLFSAYKLMDYYMTGMKEEKAFSEIRKTEESKDRLGELTKKILIQLGGSRLMEPKSTTP